MTIDDVSNSHQRQKLRKEFCPTCGHYLPTQKEIKEMVASRKLIGRITEIVNQAAEELFPEPKSPRKKHS